jgi:O-antigen/teichoic acid export membrane protein
MAFMRSISVMMGANFLLVVLSFFNNKLVYMFLDTETNGVYFLTMRLSLFIALVFGDWLRLSTLNLAGSDRRQSRTLSANILWYCLAFGVCAVSAVFVLSPAAGMKLFGISPALIVAAVIVSALAMFRDSSQSLLLVGKRFVPYGATLVVLGAVFLGLDAVLLVVFRLGLRAVIIAWIAATAVSALWAYLANAFGDGVSLRPSWGLFARSRAIGWRAFLAVAGMFLLINIHSFAIEPAARAAGEGLAMVGIFSVCFRIFQLFQRVSDVTGAFNISYVVQTDSGTGSRMTARSARGVFVFSAIAALFTFAAGKYLVLLVADSRYAAASIPLLVMLPGIVAVNTGSVLNGFYWGREYPLRIVVAPFIAAALGLALDIVLIPRMGVNGAALAFTAANVLWAAWMVARFRADTGMRLSDIFVPTMEDVRGIVAGFSREGTRKVTGPAAP